ncbi:MAG: hypothetical protein KAJ19_09665, partial [Gammaproteobacteria bacterium]|nr:hypothetical protein [Gammaproteobacteria bacterium]
MPGRRATAGVAGLLPCKFQAVRCTVGKVGSPESVEQVHAAASGRQPGGLDQATAEKLPQVPPAVGPVEEPLPVPVVQRTDRRHGLVGQPEKLVAAVFLAFAADDKTPLARVVVGLRRAEDGRDPPGRVVTSKNESRPPITSRYVPHHA